LLFSYLALIARSFISPYDQAAHAQTVNLKLDTLGLIDNVTGSYA
jgi:hypothetical protein